MKIVKNIGIAIVVFIVIVMIAGAIFLSTFDLNKYIGPIKAQASQALGRSVMIDKVKLDLNIFKGIALSVDGISIADDQHFSKNDFIHIGNIKASLNAMALITHQTIEVTSIVVSNVQARIIRDEKGNINAQTIGPQSSSKLVSDPSSLDKQAQSVESAPQAQSLQMTYPNLLVKNITMTDGTIFFTDKNKDLPIDMILKNVDARIDNFSLNQPFPMIIQAAVLSTQTNITLNTKVLLDINKQSAALSDSIIDTELSTLDLKAFKAAFPTLAKTPLPVELAGKVNIALSPLTVSAKGIEGLNAKIELNDGLVKLNELPTSLTSIHALIHGDMKNLEIKNLIATIGDGTISIKAQVNDYLATPTYHFQYDLKSLMLSQVMDPKLFPINIQAFLNSDGKFSGSSFVPDQAILNVKGEIHATVSSGVIEHLNIVSSVLQPLGNVAIIGPLLSEMLKGKLNQIIGEKSTPLNGGLFNADVENGEVIVQAMHIDTKPLVVDGLGKVNLTTMSVDISSDVTMETGISEDIIKSAKPLHSLANQQGSIFIPGKITGIIPKIGYSPDLNYISKKVASNETADALGKQLDKVFEKNPEVRSILNTVLGDEENPESENQEENSSKKLINNLFNKILK